EIVCTRRTGKEIARRREVGEDFPVGLKQQAYHRSLFILWRRVETGVECAVVIQPGDVCPRASGDAGKGSTDENAPVRLKRERSNFGLGSRQPTALGDSDMETGVQRAVRIQSCETHPGLAADRSEHSAEEDFSIRLQGQALDVIVCDRARKT